MQPLRALPWFTRLLVALFLAAQFAGVVSMPRANALPTTQAGAPHAAASDASDMHAPAHHHHAQAPDHGAPDHGAPCGHHGNGDNPADTCCALHACFAGLLPPAVAIATENVVGEHLPAGLDDLAAGAPGSRLDRPPRPQH
jgi:hypothetical protein